jgi:hypothetical protein
MRRCWRVSGEGALARAVPALYLLPIVRGGSQPGVPVVPLCLPDLLRATDRAAAVLAGELAVYRNGFASWQRAPSPCTGRAGWPCCPASSPGPA